jgi:hypothetical protein
LPFGFTDESQNLSHSIRVSASVSQTSTASGTLTGSTRAGRKVSNLPRHT